MKRVLRTLWNEASAALGGSGKSAARSADGQREAAAAPGIRRAQPMLLAIEQRLMFDGAAADTAAKAATDAAITAAETSPLPVPPAVESATPARNEVVFVESNVVDYQNLVNQISPGASVYVLDAAKDGLAQMAQFLDGRSGIDAVHILSHGSEAALGLGTLDLTAGNLQAHAADLAAIGSKLAPHGDILLYGCDIGAGADGAQFVSSLAAIAGADIAASTNLTGAAANGGDWVLERATGQIDAKSLLFADYQAILDAPVNTVPGIQTTAQDTPLVFSAGNSNLISVADADSPTLTTILSIGAGTGTLTVNTVNNGTGTLVITGDGTTSVQISGTVSEVNDALSTVTYSPTTSAHGSAYATLTIATTNDPSDGSVTTTDHVVIGVDGAGNDAPFISSGDTYSLTATDENTTSAAVTVTSILTHASWSDADTGDAKGIAVTGVSANGSWEFSADGGTTWTAFGSVSAGNALLLHSTAEVRYVPNSTNAETASFTYKAWDETSGTASTNGALQKVDTSGSGGASAFSGNNASASISVTNINEAPTGSVTLANDTDAGRGTTSAQQGDTLSVSNSLADADGLSGAISYQWQRNGANIVGETGTTYTLTQADVGAAIRVVASYTDDQSTPESKASTATSAIVNVNDLPTGSVTLANDTDAGRGTTSAQQGDTLSVSNSLADADGLSGAISYQWQRNGVNIVGETGTTYTLTQADVGAAIRVVASYTDDLSTAESKASTATSAIVDVNDAPTITNAAVDTLASTDKITTSGATTVNSILTSAGWADIDSSPSKGIAVTAVTGNGSWEFSADGGTTWTAFGTVSGASALLLDGTVKVHYVPDGLNTETATFAYKAWDETSGTASTNATPQNADTTTSGGATAFSASSASASITVTNVNTVPSIGGTVAGTAINDTGNATPFSTVTIVDPDGQTETVTVMLDSPAKGSLSNLGGGSYNASTGVYTFSGTAAAAQAAVEGLVFTPAANRVAPGLNETTTFTISVDDGVAAPVTDNATTVVTTSVNDAPAIGATTPVTSILDTATAAPFSGVTLADPDTGQTLTVTVSLDSAAKGSFTTLSGFTDAGGGNYTFSGTAAAAQAAIRGLVFTPSGDFTTTFTVSVSDGTATTTDSSTTVVSAAQPIVPPPPAPAPAPTPTPPTIDPGGSNTVQVLLTGSTAPATSVAPPPAIVVPPPPLMPAAFRPANELSGSLFSAQPEQSATTLSTTLPDRTIAATDGKVSFTIPSDALARSLGSGNVQLSATQADGRALPAWLSFNAATGTFTGQAPAGAEGTVVIKVVAKDAAGREASTVFRVGFGKPAPQRPGAGTERPAPERLAPRGALDVPETQAAAGKPAPGRASFSEQLRQASRQSSIPRRIG
ncbi:MAG: DUF4347 domain-containing protein [Ignavibacteria bacterium]